MSLVPLIFFISHQIFHLQSKASVEDRSKAWKDAELKKRREKKEADSRAAQEKIDKMTPEEREEHFRLEKEHTIHNMKRDKHLLLLAKSAGAKKGRGKGRGKLKSKRKKGRIESR